MENAVTNTTTARALGILCGAGAGALWGLVFLAPELVRDQFGPMYITAGRYLAYGLVSAALLLPRWRRIRAVIGAREWIGLAGLALIGNILYYGLLSSAVQLGGIAMTSLVIGFLPVAVTIIGSRHQHAVPLRRLALSLLLCAAGAICIGWQAVETFRQSGTQQLVGLLCAIGALISWTWFAVANSRWLLRLERISVHEWNLLTGVVTGAFTLAILPVLIALPSADHPASAWLKLAGVSVGLAVLASMVGNLLWNKMSRLLPLTLVGQMILFETLFALIYGFAWERRLPTAMELAAFTLVSLSVILCVIAHQRPAAKPAGLSAA